MCPATGISILLQIRVDGYATIHADNAMCILRDIDDPVTNIVAADCAGQGNPARHGSDSQRILANFAVGDILLPN